MNKINFIIAIVAIGIISTVIAISDIKEGKAKQQRERAILEYYESVETLLDSLCIDCGDTIFETDAGAKYLDSKYTFDSLFINNSK